MEILSDVVYKVLSNRIKIIDSYKITDRSRMSEIVYAIQHKHPEVQFDRDYKDLICEGVTHNRLYKGNIRRSKTKDVDLGYTETKLRTILYRILGI